MRLKFMRKHGLIIRLMLAFIVLAGLSMPAAAACWQWSLTAASNATADPSINWSEGMAPSAVNDSGRAMMARSAECRDDISGKLLTTGTATAYVLATNQATIATTPGDGQQLAFRPHLANGIAATLAVDGGTAFPINAATGGAVGSGVLLAGMPYRVTFSTSASAWLLQGFYNSTIAAGSVVTTMLADNSVTYQKIQKPSAVSRLLGTPSLAATAVTGAANNGSGLIRLTVASTTGLTTGQTKVVSGVTGTTEANGTWLLTVIDATHVDLQGSAFVTTYISGGLVGGSVEEILLGQGLGISGNTLVSAPAPPGSFKNLVIKVTGNTAATITADYVTTFNGTSSFRTTAVSCTMNFATTGALGLDTGSIAAATWYHLWVDVKDDSTTTCTASLQSTANGTFTGNLPAGYTHYARVGAVRTAAGVAQLMGTWQFGRQAKYIVGLAQTSAFPNPGNSSGTGLTAVSISNSVPPTASIAKLFGGATTNGEGTLGGNNSQSIVFNSNPSECMAGSPTKTGISCDVLLESTNVYVSMSSGVMSVFVKGWEDNI